MTDTMTATRAPLTLIVAATKTQGIGANGALPWPMLKKEMGYFARVTKRVPSSITTPNAQNVVIMGRKTWDSIPAKFRPLKDRTNVVITTQSREELGGVSEDVVVAGDVVAGLGVLDEWVARGSARSVGRVFVIGGSSVYGRALELPQTRHVLLTRIQNGFECDTFFPVALGEGEQGGWQRRGLKQLREFVEEDVAEGSVSETNGVEVQFEFQLYERA